jgi:hypothetical protein
MKEHNSSRHLGRDAAKCCAICRGKFGLIRHYSWRTALCSERCVDRFKSREDGDRRWLFRLQVARDTVAIGLWRFRGDEVGQ